MPEEKNDLLQELAEAVVDMDEDLVRDAARRSVDAGLAAQDAITEGLSKGMEIVGQKYEDGEYFIPQLLLCSDAMYAGVDVLKPHIAKEEKTRERVVIGVVAGDTHDIGKNLVKLFMETSGFEVFDLGRDVPVESFVSAVREYGAQLVCMSTLMTTTMDGMEKVILRLKEEGLRDRVKVIVGGGPISQAFAEKIGADAYSYSAPNAPSTAMNLIALSARER
ncbi:MAG: corrinoid protein [Synergistaceae bacterium]|nr:corrinoid protein [Synergistaceae bacterium]